MKQNGLQDGITTSGIVVATLRGPDGKIKSRTHHNMVVTAGKEHVADQLAGLLQGSMSHMAIGTGATAQALTDTALQTELNRKAFTSKDQGVGGDANKVIYVTSWPAGEGTGAITEAGIFNAASAGTMLARTTFPVKNKGVSDSLTLTWTLSIN